MKSIAYFQFLCYLILLSQLSSVCIPASARGGGHAWYDPDEFKVVRDPHAWNGDSYMSDADKSTLYKNYKSGQPINGRNGALWGGQGAYGQAAPAANYAVTGEDYSGPTYIGPSNYDCVVQNYKWDTAPKLNASVKSRQQPLNNCNIGANRTFRH